MLFRSIAAGWRLIHLVMDNSSVNTSALKQAALEEWRGVIVLHWTPTHASWLNLAEPFWSSFHRAVLQNTWFRFPHEVESATAAYLEYWRAHPREYHWPKIERQRRRAAVKPLWKRLDAIPIYS